MPITTGVVSIDLNSVNWRLAPSCTTVFYGHHPLHPLPPLLTSLHGKISDRFILAIQIRCCSDPRSGLGFGPRKPTSVNKCPKANEGTAAKDWKFGVSHQRNPTTESGDEEEKQAIDAVSDILQEFGVSKEESTDIAFRCPKYVDLLMNDFRDLDGLSLWNSWTSSSVGDASSSVKASVKQKVYEIAKKKGDKGMLPFLESIGLSLPTSMIVARYLSSESLVTLIQKVKFVKDTFFSPSNDDMSIGKRAKRLMMHLSIPVDEDIQQTLSFFEKIQAKRRGLDLLGSGDESFPYLVESFPRLLLLSTECHLKPLVAFLEDFGVPKECMRQILLLFPPVIFYGIENDLKPRMQPFKKEHAGNKVLRRMLLMYPWILSTSVQENYQEILTLFYTEKVDMVDIRCAIEDWPLLLGCSTRKLKLMIDQFGDFGVNNTRLGQLVARSPQLLMRKPKELCEVVSFFKDLGLDDETVGRVLSRCPEIFAANIERTLRKKVEFLTDIGISKNHLPRAIRKYPELFVCNIDKALLPRIKYLLKLGLSSRDIASMVVKFSPLLGYSIEEVLRPKIEFLVNTMGKSVEEVVDYPRYFSYSLEKKIKPRYWLLKGWNLEFSLKDMLGKNDEEFEAVFFEGSFNPPCD